MKTIFIILSIIMISSVVYAEQVEVSIDTPTSYVFVTLLFESDEMIQTIDEQGEMEIFAEGLTETTVEMDSGNVLVVSIAPIRMILDSVDELVDVTITTENFKLFFMATGNITAGFTLN